MKAVYEHNCEACTLVYQGVARTNKKVDVYICSGEEKGVVIRNGNDGPEYGSLCRDSWKDSLKGCLNIYFEAQDHLDCIHAILMHVTGEVK